MAPLILLVGTDPTLRRRVDSLLSEAGYLVAAASSFPNAKHLLESVSPDLVIADLRLDAFNGLHLAVRCRTDHPLLPVIITHDQADAMLEKEASRLGAAWVVRPLEDPGFLPRVQAALVDYGRRQQPVRRWRRKQLAEVIEAEIAEAPARVYDVSYGGLRLAFEAEQPLPEVFDVRLPNAGVTVKARPVWKFRSPTTDEFWCGAELVDAGIPDVEMTVWRHFVDGS